MLEDKRKIFIELLPLILVFCVCLVWLFTGDWVNSDPYRLGLVRGFVWPTLIFQWIKGFLNR